MDELYPLRIYAHHDLTLTIEVAGHRPVRLDIAPFLTGPVFEPLRDPRLFVQARLEDGFKAQLLELADMAFLSKALSQISPSEFVEVHEFRPPLHRGQRS
jgi:hypothetical protein